MAARMLRSKVQRTPVRNLAAGLRNLADARVAGDHQAAQRESGFFEAVIGIRQIEPAIKALVAASGEQFDGT